jgi:hypothetical protein
MTDSDSDASMNEVEEVEGGAEADAEAEAEVESTSSESKVDLAEKHFPRFEDVVKANDLDEDWYEPLPARVVGGKKRSWACDVSRCMKRGHPQFDMGQTDGN